MQETQVRSLGREESLEKEKATHSRIPAREIPWTEGPGSRVHGVAKRVAHKVEAELGRPPYKTD